MTENMDVPTPHDLLKLKALVPALVEACPDMYELARGIAKDILNKHGLPALDPEQVYWHRFHLAQSSSATFTGWEHIDEQPYETMTLPQLVIQRFSVYDVDNADLLDLYGGFYSVGPQAGDYNETNEVRLHGNDVLKDFWAINFSDLYKNKVASFWKNNATTYRTLAKCTFLAKAMEDREGGRLSDENFKTVIKAVAGNVSWPVTRQMLEVEAPAIDGLRVTLLKVGDFVATDILCILDDRGRQILYVPGEVWGLHALETPRDLHWWILSQTQKPTDRQRFMSHFQAADHDIMEDTAARKQSKLDWLSAINPLGNALNSLASLMFREPHIENVGLTHVLDLLFNAWNIDDHRLIDHVSGSLNQDAFTFLSTAVHARMISDGNFMLHSNAQLRKKLWIGYLNAFGRTFGPMAAVGWPVALAVVGAGFANVGLNIDQAVTGKNALERKAGVVGAILAGIDTLFNATFLKGSGGLPEIAEGNAFIAPEEASGERAVARTVLPELEEIVPERILPAEPEDYLESFKTDITELTREVEEPQKMRGIIHTRSGKNYIYMRRAGRDGFYQVRYVGQMKRWVIIDPANPYSFYRNIPVRQNEALRWEPIPRAEAGAGLSGGGKIFGCWPWGRNPNPLPELDIEPPNELPEPFGQAPSATMTPAVESLPRTPYELPVQSRVALRPVAEGRTDDFPLDPNDGSERPYQDFRTQRRGLYDDAIEFHEHPPAPSRPAIPDFKPGAPNKSIIKRLLKDSPGLVIGQESGNITGQRFLIDDMEFISKQKVKTLYLDRLLSDIHQADLDIFNSTGKMPANLQRYLKKLDWTLGTDPADQYGYLKLVRSARENHIRIQAIDCMASARFPRMENTSFTSSLKMKNYFSDSIIRTDQAARGAHKWVALVGSSRTNTLAGVPGLSELEGAVGLRIEEIPDAETPKVGADPGKQMWLNGSSNNSDFIKSDLRLKVRALPPIKTASSMEQALPRAGMFTIQDAADGPKLYLRSLRQGLITLDIQKGEDGFFVDSPFLILSKRRYGDLSELSEALQQEELRQVRVRIKPQTDLAVSETGESEPVPGSSASQRPSWPARPAPAVTPYDIPLQWRAELNNAAAGAEDKLLSKWSDVTYRTQAYEIAKAIRSDLYKDTELFYLDPQLPARPTTPAVDPHITQADLIRTLLKESKGLVIGEMHGDIGSKQLLIEQMQALADADVNTLYLEHLLSDFHQASLDAFAESSIMPKELEDYLQYLDAGFRTDPLARYNFLELVREANRNGMRIRAIDCLASYREGGGVTHDVPRRMKVMNFYARTIIRADETARAGHKWVALVGALHANTVEGIAGVSELEGTLGLRVEDVDVGHSTGVVPDPGDTPVTSRPSRYAGVSKSDLRLQVEVPWPESTEMNALLSRPGLYTLKRGSNLIVYRNARNEIKSTYLHNESGRYFINDAYWPSLKGQLFKSPTELLQALDKSGMTLAGWPEPL